MVCYVILNILRTPAFHCKHCGGDREVNLNFLATAILSKTSLSSKNLYPRMNLNAPKPCTINPSAPFVNLYTVKPSTPLQTFRPLKPLSSRSCAGTMIPSIECEDILLLGMVCYQQSIYNLTWFNHPKTLPSYG